MQILKPMNAHIDKVSKEHPAEPTALKSRLLQKENGVTGNADKSYFREYRGHSIFAALKEVENKKYLWAAFVSSVTFFMIFKLFYPYADYSNDSYSYIGFATSNENIGIRPIGYSKFLRAFSALSTSDTLLVAFQYTLIQAGALYFFFSLRLFFKPGRLINDILFSFLLLNPVSLYVGNYVGSDALFIALSMLWITHLLWTIHQPARYDIVIHSILLILILALRYNALYYPLISTVAFMLSRNSRKVKALGAVTAILVTGASVWLVSNETNARSGVRTYSTFGGWQMANNALYMHRYLIAGKSIRHSTSRYSELDSLSIEYFSKSEPENFPPLIASEYLWDEHAPLKQFWYSYIKKHQVTDSIKAWHAIGPMLGSYGFHLVKQHPASFVRYFLWPNTKEYFRPWLEVFEYYNQGQDSVKTIAKDWFRYESGNTRHFSKYIEPRLLVSFPLLFGIVNIAFLAGFIRLFIAARKQKVNVLLYHTILFTAVFLVVNFGFSVFAAPVVFRYQYFPLLIYGGGCLVMMDDLLKGERNNNYDNQ